MRYKKDQLAESARLNRAAELPALQSLDDDVLLDTLTTASYTGVPHKTLANWRTAKTSPIPYIKIGSHVRYRAGDLKTLTRSVA